VTFWVNGREGTAIGTERSLKGRRKVVIESGTGS
jgi:hypothetical protein